MGLGRVRCLSPNKTRLSLRILVVLSCKLNTLRKGSWRSSEPEHPMTLWLASFSAFGLLTPRNVRETTQPWLNSWRSKLLQQSITLSAATERVWRPSRMVRILLRRAVDQTKIWFIKLQEAAEESDRLPDPEVYVRDQIKKARWYLRAFDTPSDETELNNLTYVGQLQRH